MDQFSIERPSEGSDARSESGRACDRRAFLRGVGMTTTMLLGHQFRAMAGPFSANDFEKIIPADKKLSKDWIAGLYARGETLTASKGGLRYIGMPVSGICTG